VPDPHNLSLKTRINGELRQDGNTNDFVHNIPRLIEFCSQGNTLQAGSIIMTGTCSGVGIGLKPPQYLQSGDLVEITFENVGTLRHGIKYV
jgi:2-keto-4-pentenoate hydratase/2-oxohepta-3-ene-1,7-dioic acid hydratase in catechol pathway